MRIFPLLATLAATYPLLLVAQAPVNGRLATERPDSVPRARVVSEARAVRATVAPVIDGRDDDAVWATAPVIREFRVYDPVEDGEPTFRTEARVAYDDRNLYVFVRAFDPHPDSIRARLARRDLRAGSDEISVFVDAYHDRRSGFVFSISAAGVKRDLSIANDSDEDESWDAVWDAEARIDALGWTAEFRIPLSQLRYAAAPTHTFGLAIAREVARLNERDSWPAYHRSRAGIASQFGDLTGFAGLASPRRLELVPYTVVRTSNEPRGAAYRQQGDVTGGVDLKYGITSNLTVDATINPDFGQVESDPSQLNLSAFESFFEERRPFFLEGQGAFRCSDGCDQLFYSRRIGRAPQLSGLHYADDNPTSTTILGAAKLSGRLASGLSIGFLDAVTREMHGDLGGTIEPRTNYLVTRLQQDFGSGRSSLGATLTGANRANDSLTALYLRSSALAAELDARHRWHDGEWEAKGYLSTSRVTGSRQSIASTQLGSTHYYQRPDGGLDFDSTRTSLLGSSGSLSVSKIGGGVVRYDGSYRYTSPGFEVNDVGFLPRADEHRVQQHVGLRFQKTEWFRQANFNVNSFLTTTAASRLRTNTGVSTHGYVQLLNSWSLHGGMFAGNLGSYCERCSRGGPAIRQSVERNVFVGVSGDDRLPVVPNLFTRRSMGDDGHSTGWGIDPNVDFRLSTRFAASVGLSYGHDQNDLQWVGNFGVIGADSTHYTFAHLDQRTASITTRLDVTASPVLSLQVYAQPFVTSGTFSDWRELRDPRAAAFSDRYKPYGSETALRTDNDFNFKQLRSTSVIRWEYRPGSALFFVWTQERTQDDLDPGSFSAGRDYRNLLGAHPRNVFLVKGSYWLSA